MNTAIHRCRICDRETRSQRITANDGTEIISHHCYCGFIEPERNSRSSASGACEGNSSHDLADRSQGRSASLGREEQSGFRPGARAHG